MSNLDMIFKVPVWRGSNPSVVVFIGTKHRVPSPLERWLGIISMNRPKMESRPYEFLLQNVLNVRFIFIFWWHPRAYRILAPRPGIEPASGAEESWSLNNWTAREVPKWAFKIYRTQVL